MKDILGHTQVDFCKRLLSKRKAAVFCGKVEEHGEKESDYGCNSYETLNHEDGARDFGTE